MNDPQKKEEKESGASAMSPMVIGFILFVVLGSSIFQIIQSLQAV